MGWLLSPHAGQIRFRFDSAFSELVAMREGRSLLQWVLSLFYALPSRWQCIMFYHTDVNALPGRPGGVPRGPGEYIYRVH